MAAINSVADLAIDGEVALVTINSPPVNALSQAVRDGLSQGVEAAEANEAVKAIVIICGGRTFIAGADISEFGKPPAPPYLPDVLDRIENASKPVVAALHGTALGGGFEVALTAHYRIAVPSAKCGLPEIKLGLIPGAGGTQRLPRLIGVEKALDVILSGSPFGAREAKEWGVVDELAEEGKLRESALAYARRLIAEKAPLRKVRDRSDKLEPARGHPEIFEAIRKANARKFRGFEAWEKAIQSVKNAVELKFDEGIVKEREMFMALLQTTQSKAQRHVFFAERQAAKVADIPADEPTASHRQRRRDRRRHHGRRHRHEFPERRHPCDDRRDLEGGARPRRLDHAAQLRGDRQERPPDDERGRGAHGQAYAFARFGRFGSGRSRDRGGLRGYGIEEERL